MSSQPQNTFDVVEEAKQVARETLGEREAQGLVQNGPVERAAAKNIEGMAREFFTEEKKYENKKPQNASKEQPNEVEDLITL